MALSSSCISWRSLRSSAPSGSSRSSTRGRLTSARASATRCRWPPDSWPGSRALVALEADHAQRLADPPCALVPRHLADHQAVAHVVGHVHVREQGVVLEHGVDVAVVGRQRGRRPGRRAGRRPPVGSSKPAIMRSVVVLPEPDGPSSEKNSPWAMSRSTPATATTSPYSFRTARAERRARRVPGGRRPERGARRSRRSLAPRRLRQPCCPAPPRWDAGGWLPKDATVPATCQADARAAG